MVRLPTRSRYISLRALFSLFCLSSCHLMLKRLPLWFGDYCMKDEAALRHFLNSNMSCKLLVCVPDFDVENLELSFASPCDGHRILSE